MLLDHLVGAGDQHRWHVEALPRSLHPATAHGRSASKACGEANILPPEWPIPGAPDQPPVERPAATFRQPLPGIKGVEASLKARFALCHRSRIRTEIIVVFANILFTQKDCHRLLRITTQPGLRLGPGIDPT